MYCATVYVHHNVCMTCGVLQVTRVVLLWVNNHFNDFETEPKMCEFLEKFEHYLDREVSSTSKSEETSADPKWSIIPIDFSPV